MTGLVVGTNSSIVTPAGVAMLSSCETIIAVSKVVRTAA